jgi:hypothetical protein
MAPPLRTITLLRLVLLMPALIVACRDSTPGTRPVDGGMDGNVDRGKLPRPDASCPADAAGGGVCPTNFCGQLKPASALPSSQVPQSGADTLCGTRVCVVGAVLASGDGFQLACVDPIADAIPFGMACSPDPAQGLRCAADSLCVTVAEFPSSPFCSTMCRNDADCPSGARCLEQPTKDALPNGEHAMVGMCTPETKIMGRPCVRESECAAGEGCHFVGPRSTYRRCRATTGTKSLGQACGSPAECRSGECFDRDWHVGSGVTRAACSGACVVSSDCGPDQRCARLVVGNNGTPNDPLDDQVSGYCRTLFTATTAAACTTDASCVARQNGSDACDTTYGLCYRRAAEQGSPCTQETECPVASECSMGPRFTGGYCQLYGCSMNAALAWDSCPGVKTICAQRGGPDEPIAACYESCMAGDASIGCSRTAEGYACEAPRPGTSPTICLVGSGT